METFGLFNILYLLKNSVVHGMNRKAGNTRLPAETER